MKKIQLFLALVLIFSIFSCDNNVSSSTTSKEVTSSENFTQEELFDEWKKAKEYTINYNNEYTSSFNVEIYKDNVLMDKNDTYQTYKDGMTLIEKSSYILDNDKLELYRYSKEATKIVDDNGKQRIKYYNEQGDSKNKETKGEYITLSKAKKMNYYNPNSFLEGLNIEGENYNEFITILKTSFIEIDEKNISVSFDKNNEMINLNIIIKHEYVDDSIDDQGYLKSNEEGTMVISSKDNKIVETKYDYNIKINYENEENNYKVNHISHGNINYNFDKEKYNKISVETETTLYNDKEEIRYYVGDFAFVYPQKFEYNEIFTANDGIEYLSNHENFIIKEKQEDVSNYISLYLDKEMTKPFTSMTLLDELTLYIKFNMPSDKSLVICAIDNDTYFDIANIYLLNVGDSFNPKKCYPYTQILSIDGKEVDNNSSLDFVVNDNTIHTVIFDGY